MSTKKDATTESREFPNGNELPLHYWGAMKYFVGLIRSSELKAGLILSFYGIIFNFVYQNLENAQEAFERLPFLYLLASLWLVFTLISIYFCVRCFIPRIEKNYDPNIFFFGDIISKFGDIRSYSETFLDDALGRENIYKQLGQQIYINAKITAQKFKNVNKAIRFLVYSLMFLLFTVLVEVLSSILVGI